MGMSRWMLAPISLRCTWLVGPLLVAAWWPLSWLHVEPFSEYSFFPLWLGYILSIDGLVFQRNGTSLLARSPAAFVGMFLVSLPLWWTFEGINQLTNNWHYEGAEDYSQLKYVLVASWHFSIVVPAVFETAELIASLTFLKRFKGGPRLPVSRPVLMAGIALGLLACVGLVFWPRYSFAGAWLCLFLVLDPVNNLRGRPSILAWLEVGDWRPVLALSIGALACGWFWEMWNYWAYPKWEYTIAFVDFAPIFEMPLLGYGGYLPFGLEVYAVYHFVSALPGRLPRVSLNLGNIRKDLPAQG